MDLRDSRVGVGIANSKDTGAVLQKTTARSAQHSGKCGVIRTGIAVVIDRDGASCRTEINGVRESDIC